MSLQQSWAEMLPGLRKAGVEQAEMYVKRGRSRRYERRPWASHDRLSREAGWAVRGSGGGGSLMLCATGEPTPPAAWPPLSGRPIDLPRGQRIPAWKATTDLDAPLLSEVEAAALLEKLEQALWREIPEARITRAVLEDGASESALLSSRGVEATWRARSASLLLEVQAPEQPTVRLHVAETEARRLQVSALARRLVDRLLVVRDGSTDPATGGELILHPQVGVRLLVALQPFLIGDAARRRLPRITAAGATFASPLVSLIDNGRFPGGVLDAPVDGEGMPTGESVLVEQGHYRQPLLDWRMAAGGADRATGCRRRSSWRDWPEAGPTHLYLAPDPAVRPADLLASVDRGHYLLDVVGRGWFDSATDRFSLPVCGFTLLAGEAPGALSRARLSGRLGDFLRGVEGVARDLTFFPLRGMLGVPTLLVSGLELSPS